jgi:Protein of unknown function, DUF547
MARLRLLNPTAAATRTDPVALSREILAEAKALTSPEQCVRLDSLAAQLHSIDPSEIAGDASRIAFWANLYNALVLHCLCLRPLRGSLLWHLRLFDRVAYRVGGHDYPLNLIENGILRVNRHAPFRLRRPLRATDPRLAAAPSRIDPRIHFALNCGALSCPPIRDYQPEALDAQLELATRAYLEAETVLEPQRRRVRLPRLMRLYAADFGDRASQLEFASRYLPRLADLLRESDPGVRIRYSRFDWSVAARPSS